MLYNFPWKRKFKQRLVYVDKFSINFSTADRDALGGVSCTIWFYRIPSHDFRADGHGSCVSSV